jgi:hypothetical protein
MYAKSFSFNGMYTGGIRTQISRFFSDFGRQVGESAEEALRPVPSQQLLRLGEMCWDLGANVIWSLFSATLTNFAERNRPFS